MLQKLLPRQCRSLNLIKYFGNTFLPYFSPFDSYRDHLSTQTISLKTTTEFPKKSQKVKFTHSIFEGGNITGQRFFFTTTLKYLSKLKGANKKTGPNKKTGANQKTISYQNIVIRSHSRTNCPISQVFYLQLFLQNALFKCPSRFGFFTCKTN